MRAEPLVSVVVPTYARSALLRRALQSVQGQSYRRLEILVVDDCSFDDTRQMVQGLRDERLRLLSQERHRGVPAISRNTGIGTATGDYVAFLDDDDVWRPDKLQRQLDYMARNACDASLCAWVGSTGVIRRHRGSFVRLSDLRRGNDFAPGSGLVVRAGLIRAVRFDETIGPGEDWDVLIRLARLTRIGYLDEVLYEVNEGQHERVTNRARNRGIPELQGRTAVVRKHSEFFGRYWSAYHEAEALLSYLRARRGKLGQIGFAVKRCGIGPVSAVLLSKVGRRMSTTGIARGRM